MRKYLLAATAPAILALSCATAAFAGPIEVFVGYADNLRPSPFFPTPFFGDPSVALFAGQNPNVLQLDAGAIRVLNTGASDITINDLSVQLNPGTGSPVNFHLWGSFLAGGFVLHPSQNAVFTQTTQFDFDTSDFGIINGQNGNSPTNNCSTGAFSTMAICTQNAPLVTLTIGGMASVLADTGHVLDTGGFDTLNSNPCVGGNNPAGGNTPGNCNESLQWRDIGTTGIENPGGGSNVPEPASLALLASGLVGLRVLRRRKKH
jgi:hypothetical protein